MSKPRLTSLLVLMVACPAMLVCVQTVSAQPRAGLGSERMTARETIEEALKKFDEGDYAESKMLLDRARGINPGLPKLALVEGLLIMEINPQSSIQALGLLEKYNKSSEGKNDYRGHAAVGKLYRDSRMWRQARHPLETAMSLAPRSGDSDWEADLAQLHIHLSAVYFRLGMSEEAIKAATAASKTAPNDPDIHFQLGRMAAASAENFDEARASVGKAISLIEARLKDDPFDVQDYRLLQSCHGLMIQTYRIDLSKHAEDPVLYQRVAEALCEAGRIEWRKTLLNAREFAIQAVERAPRDANLLVFVAQLESDLGAKQDALDRLRGVLSFAPENKKALQLQAKIQDSSGQQAAPK